MMMENNGEKLENRETEVPGEHVIDSPFLARLQENIRLLREGKKEEGGKRERVTEGKGVNDVSPQEREKSRVVARREAQIHRRRFGQANGENGHEETAEEIIENKFQPSPSLVEELKDGLDQYCLASLLWEGVRESRECGPSQELLLNVISILKSKAELILRKAEDREMDERDYFNRNQDEAREMVGTQGAGARRTSRKSVKSGFSVEEITSVARREGEPSSERDAARKESTKIMAYVYDLRIARIFKMKGKKREETRELDKKIETLRSIAHTESPFESLKDALARGVITDSEYEGIISGVHEELPERGALKSKNSDSIDVMLRKYAQAYGEGDISSEAYFAIDRILRSDGASAMKELRSAKAAGDIDDAVYNDLKEFFTAAKQKEN